MQLWTKMTSAEFNAADAANYDGFALGCPAMGAEQLEESEFEPMYQDLRGSLVRQAGLACSALRHGRRRVDPHLG